PFNRGFAWLTERFLGAVRLALRHSIASLLIFVAMLALTVGLFLRIPGSFVPSEDQGYIFATAQLPDGATLERTRAMTAELTGIVAANSGVQNTLGIAGFDLIGGGNKTNTATMFVPLKEWDERGENTAQAIARDIVKRGG